jgi:5-methylcytosine-specific restriction endonuclease McrA
LEQSRSAGRRHAREWRESHPEEIKAALRSYRQSHRESIRASIKAWEKANPDKNRASRRRASARYNFLKHSNGTYEPIKPEEIFERDHWRCKACRVETPKELQGTLEDNAPTLDHIIPVSLGGPHTRRNLRCLCRKCNCAKHAKYNGQLAFA